MPKVVTITATWRSRHPLEVPDDWEVPNTLDGFTEDQLEEITSHTAELVDWE